MIRTKGEAGTGDIVNAVTHMRSVFGAHHASSSALREEELYCGRRELRAPYELVSWVAENGSLPVVTFTAGGIATPADAALCMQLGADGVFVGSGHLQVVRTRRRAREGDRRGDHALPRMPRSWRASPAASGDAMAGSAAAGIPPGRATSRPGAGKALWGEDVAHPRAVQGVLMLRRV